MIQADATDADAVGAAVEKTVTTFGRLDVLVNNAGTAIPKRFEKTTLEELDRLIDINVRGNGVERRRLRASSPRSRMKKRRINNACNESRSFQWL